MKTTTTYSIAGPDTFRLASRKCPDGSGTNMQNWDKDVRYLVIPSEGKILGQSDQSGAEAKIVAYLCRKGNFRALFDNNIKPHVYVAMQLFQDQWKSSCEGVSRLCCLKIQDLKQDPEFKPLEKLIKESDNWPPSKRYYYMAKQVCHAANYKIGKNEFVSNTLKKSEGAIVLKPETAQEFLDFYYKLFPEILEWHRAIENQVRTTMLLKNLFGHPRKFTGLFRPDLLKKALAFIPQSTVGMITNIAIVELQERIDNGELPGLDLLQNGHDSILWQCYIGDEKDMAVEVAKHLNRKLLSPRGEPFSMSSEVAVGYNWKPASEKNPEGLKEIKL